MRNQSPHPELCDRVQRVHAARVLRRRSATLTAECKIGPPLCPGLCVDPDTAHVGSAMLGAGVRAPIATASSASAAQRPFVCEKDLVPRGSNLRDRKRLESGRTLRTGCKHRHRVRVRAGIPCTGGGSARGSARQTPPAAGPQVRRFLAGVLPRPPRVARPAAIATKPARCATAPLGTCNLPRGPCVSNESCRHRRALRDRTGEVRSGACLPDFGSSLTATPRRRAGRARQLSSLNHSGAGGLVQVNLLAGRTVQVGLMPIVGSFDCSFASDRGLDEAPFADPAPRWARPAAYYVRAEKRACSLRPALRS